MIKVYEIVGVVETSKIFRVGEVIVRCTFSGGSVNESGTVPAVYTTSDFVIQSIIEASRDFKNGLIKVKEIKGSNVKSDEPIITKEFHEVTNIQSARAVLMDKPYNIPLGLLQNKAAILNKAAELNVVFPNWK